MTGDQPVLYLLGTGAQPVLTIAAAVEQAQADGWRVCLGLTPTAARWLHPYLAGLEALTGAPVRSHYKLPGEEDVWPTADVVLLAPATFNTINRWALGLTDSFVVGYAAEALGRGIPTVALPCVNAALAAHPQYARSVETLRLAGARVVLPETNTAPGQDDTPDFGWALALHEARNALQHPAP
ncbi:flavoprotein [Streptacidiphilus jiangxiensis]|uniref:Flavoprotein n=1 Tax=Streptacidiphilus jiangxiensis TaxID=235985 RepID=A0A1H7RNZ2_STRJI|nr:flavoprotein [Streptacidiphilus jiangxiensis]SEL61769.1 Flavoprotein [Streptacidiphilus jiangxiensis]